MHWARPEILSTWFATYYNGLFIWQPIAAIGLIGILRLWRRDIPLMAGAMLFFLAQTYVNASAGDWFGGGGFGPRRFDSMVPFFALGVALVMARAGMVGRAALGIGALGWLWVHWILLTYVVPRRGEWFPGNPMELARESLPAWSSNLFDLGRRIASHSISIWNEPTLLVHPGSPVGILLGKSPGGPLPVEVLLAAAALASAMVLLFSLRWPWPEGEANRVRFNQGPCSSTQTT